ncbi:MAG: glycosyltransferase family 4 protein [Verrucomicrobia bacterium]|nr:glycosyltransferase family 4 protein [Verrucomicrobiota bacterium]
MKIAILHYTSWPVIGGVESVIRQHAQLLSRHGHEVTILCGEGAAFDQRIQILVLPELNSQEALVRCSQAEAYHGRYGQSYLQVREAIQKQLDPLCKTLDCLVVHNMFTMPFNLAATQALSGIADRGTRTVAWTHDLAASNPDYQIPPHPMFDLIRERQPGVKYVTISQARAIEFRQLMAAEVDAIIPNGLDFVGACAITPEVADLVREDLPASIILFYPTRILPRKNIAFALQIVAALRDLGLQVRLLVSGAPDSHNRSSADHFARLKRLAADLQVQQSVSWVNELFHVDERQLHSLYKVADAMLFPSRQEGFGLPLLEAAAHRLPVFCSNIKPLKSVALSGTLLFELHDAPGNVAEQIRNAFARDAIFKRKKQLLRDYSAERLYLDKVEPFLRDLL